MTQPAKAYIEPHYASWAQAQEMTNLGKKPSQVAGRQNYLAWLYLKLISTAEGIPQMFYRHECRLELVKKPLYPSPVPRPPD